jgi:hypothetical protein
MQFRKRARFTVAKPVLTVILTVVAAVIRVAVVADPK